MALNIGAKLMIGELPRPLNLRLTEGTDVEIDASTGRTYFKGIEVTLDTRDINGRIGYRDETEGWIPCEFVNNVRIIVDVFVSNEFLLREFVLGDTGEIPVNGNSAWVQLREVGELYDSDRVQYERKRNGILELFNMEKSDAVMLLSPSMDIKMY